MLTVPSSLHSAYLHLLTDLDELGHLVLQLAVPLHQVGQIVLQGLLLGKQKKQKCVNENVDQWKHGVY